MAESELERSNNGFFLMVGVLDDRSANILYLLQDWAILGKFRNQERDYAVS